jgi:hypothetical protein
VGALQLEEVPEPATVGVVAARGADGDLAVAGDHKYLMCHPLGESFAQ